ncbi:MAG: HAD hydrolase family protein [Phycisphaerales bacterium]
MHHDAAKIELLALDVDGVMTDGSIMLDDQGVEIKRFNSRDGFGIILWQRMGFRTAIITGRVGEVVKARARELKIAHVIQGTADKSASLDDLCRAAEVAPERVAYIGDDWPDLPVLRRVGFPVAVADALPAVRAAAAMVTKAPGGHGAVREVVDHLLEARGLMARALALYDQSHGPEPTPPT